VGGSKTHLDLGYVSQQELLAAVVDGSSVAHYMVDRAGLVLMWNPAAEKVFGWTAAEAIGRRLPFVTEQTRPEYDRLRREVFVSARRLQEPALLTDVATALAVNRMTPCRLQLEVTETAVITDLRRAAEVLAELRTQGVVLALDDFGTGFSSLTLLRDLPIDVLKIDGSFVSGDFAGSANASIVAATLQLAAALGLHAVAERYRDPCSGRGVDPSGLPAWSGLLLRQTRARPLHRSAHCHPHSGPGRRPNLDRGGVHRRN